MESPSSHSHTNVPVSLDGVKTCFNNVNMAVVDQIELIEHIMMQVDAMREHLAEHLKKGEGRAVVSCIQFN